MSNIVGYESLFEPVPVRETDQNSRNLEGIDANAGLVQTLVETRV